MDISFHCDKCGQKLELDEAGAGTTVECPQCRQSLTVPIKKKTTSAPLPPPTDSPTNLQNCPDCGRQVSKRATSCPHCGAPILANGVSPTAAYMPVVAAKSSVQDGVRIGIGFMWVVGLLALLTGVVIFCGEHLELLVIPAVGFIFVAFLLNMGKKAMDRDKRKTP